VGLDCRIELHTNSVVWIVRAVSALIQDRKLLITNEGGGK
jgi:hypothetical protein